MSVLLIARVSARYLGILGSGVYTEGHDPPCGEIDQLVLLYYTRFLLFSLVNSH
jgi:hypothetical protein